MDPYVGCGVHYVSYGTPGGEYTSECRAAIVTEANTPSDTVGLAVFNPTGLLFDRTVVHDEQTKAGGTWHWAEPVTD